MSSLTRVAVCQIGVVIGNPPANRRACFLAIEQAVATGAKVIVLPELVNSGYVFESMAEVAGLAEPIDGVTTSQWLSLARKNDVVIVGGLCERDDAGAIRNSAVLVGPSGVLAVYRKAHLWADEGRFFVAGEEPPPIVSTEFGRISVMVCYDVEFPEWVRMAALGGADLLCVPANWPAESVPPSEILPIEVVRIMANASMNGVSIAVAARVNTERGTAWVGGSGVAHPSGALVTGLRDGPHVAVTDIPIGPERARALGYSPIGDRRPELYARD